MSKKEDERQRKAHEEYVELLKMKQGLIEESEIIPETGYVEMPELNAWGKFKNYVYHNKFFILVGVFIAALLTFLIVQTVTRKVNDLYVLVISTSPGSELAWRSGDLEDALTKYCPDFDNNGYVKVGVNYIDLSFNSGTPDYNNAQSMKFTAELLTGDSQLFIADEGLWERLRESEGVTEAIFEDLSEYFPEEDLYNKDGLHINSVGLHKDARWDTCSDKINLYLRCEFTSATGNQKEADEQRKRAQTVLRNIVEGNIINPEVEEE